MSDMIDAIKPALWNDAVNESDYADGSDKYQGAVLEQYKLYVEMADRVSSRRGLANTFFLTLNSGILTVLAVFWKDPPSASEWLLAFPLPVSSVNASPGTGSCVPTGSSTAPSGPWWERLRNAYQHTSSPRRSGTRLSAAAGAGRPICP